MSSETKPIENTIFRPQKSSNHTDKPDGFCCQTKTYTPPAQRPQPAWTSTKISRSSKPCFNKTSLYWERPEGQGRIPFKPRKWIKNQKDSPKLRVFKAHTHTMDWVTWMICMCQAAPSWTNHPEIRKRCAYLSHKHHHLQSKMVQSYTFIASIQNDFWSKLRSKGKHETFITFPGSSNWKVAKKRWFRLSHQRPPNKPKKQIAHLRVGNS